MCLCEHLQWQLDLKDGVRFERMVGRWQATEGSVWLKKAGEWKNKPGECVLPWFSRPHRFCGLCDVSYSALSCLL